MTIFDIVYDICNKKSNRMDKQIDWDDVNASSFILRRWVGFTSPENAVFINEYANMTGCQHCDDKNVMYHLLSSITIPVKKFKYLKSEKRNQEKNETLDKQAAELGLSKKERLEYDSILATFSSQTNDKK